MLATQISLRPHHTFGVEASARWWKTVRSETDALEFLMDNAGHLGPLLVLGGGSNVLFLHDFPGLVLQNDIRGKEVVKENETTVWLKVGAGENWHELVQSCLEHDWGGLENLSLIPGRVGAAPIQNIGAYGVELEEVFEQLEALHLQTGQIHVFSRGACQFGYRDSVFKRQLKGQYLITRVVLRLTKKTHQLRVGYGALEQELASAGVTEPGIREVSEAVIRIRRSKLPDPAELGNAGSFFKNPVISATRFEALQRAFSHVPHYPQADGQQKVPAAWLIDTCGWKGVRRGNCGVHPRQALVLVNYGGATGAEIWALAQEIRASVADRFGVELESEVNVIGG